MKNKSVKEIKEIVDSLSIDKYLEYMDILKDDERKSVQNIAIKMGRKLDNIRKEEERLELINTYENEGYTKGYLYIGGIDEAGRGPLAGPVVASVVVFKPNTKIEGINDSKKTFVSMNGQEVFRFAVRKVPECIEELISKMKIEKSEIDLFLLHQANKRILESIGKRLKVSMDLIPENVSEYGNTSSASIPILLDEMVRDGKIQKGNKIIMAGFGAGLTWSAVYLEF